MNKKLETKLKTLPRTPGVYFHKSKNGEVIYVGKAAVLKNRVRSYFQNSKTRDLKTYALVQEIHDTEWIETESEIDALFLESEMIKRYMPRYNVLLRDDKSQLFVRIDMKNDWPHVSFTRNPADDGAEYIGPFYNGYAVKKALRYLRKIFPYYTKPDGKQTSRLDEDLGLSPKRAEGSEGYKQNLKKLMSYIKGNRVAIAKELEKEMKQAAKNHDFETAAFYRNKLHAMKELQRRVMFGDSEHLDISKDRALNDLTIILGMEKPLKRIEGYDISHQSGQNVVASMVVFTNGVSDRAGYRKFKMKTQKNDDTANMYETIYRRLGQKNLASWGEPDLLLIDGGKPQLSAAIKAQQERGTKYPVVSIAKREEEIVVHEVDSNIDISKFQKNLPAGTSVQKDGNYTVINLHAGQRNLGSHTKNLRGELSLSPYSDVVKLIQRIRDESHRFAIGYHNTLKLKNQTASALDMIPGVGTVTRKKLLKEFDSMRGIRAASEEEIAAVVGARLANTIKRLV